MPRVQQSSVREANWTLVNARHPCPVCGAADGCSMHDGAEFAYCARRPSHWPLTNGAWLHRLERVAVAVASARPIELAAQSSVRRLGDS